MHAGVCLSAAGIKMSRRFFLFIVQGTGLDGGEATSAGSMLIVELVHPSTQRMTTPHYGRSICTSLHTRFISR